MGITQKIRKEINKQAGDLVHIIIVKDDAPRIVTIPEDFDKILDENVKDKKSTFMIYLILIKRNILIG